MSRFRLGLLLTVVAAGVAATTMVGIGVRATYGAHTTADEPQYLLSAISLWEDRDLDISDELGSERYREFHAADLPVQTRLLMDGRRISPHNPLLPFLLAVPMGLWGWVGVKASLALLSGGVAALLVWTAHRRFDVRPLVATVAVVAFALAPPLAVYATQVYPELPAALFVTVAVAALTGRPSRISAVVAIVAVVTLPWLAVKYVPVAAVLAVATWMRAPRPFRMWVLGLLGMAGAGYVATHWAIYGGLTPYATGDHFVGGEFTAVGADPDLWGRATRLIGLLVDRGFGLAAWQPAYLLVPVAAAAMWRRSPDGARLLVGLLATGWLVATFVALTMHGWWFPGRQLVVVLPAAVLLIVSWADTSRLNWGLALGLGAVGVGSFAFLVAEGLGGQLTWAVDFASTDYPPYVLFSAVLPDYMDDSPATWIGHGIWTLVLIALVALGRWSVGRSAAHRGSLAPELERHAI